MKSHKIACVINPFYFPCAKLIYLIKKTFHPGSASALRTQTLISRRRRRPCRRSAIITFNFVPYQSNTSLNCVIYDPGVYGRNICYGDRGHTPDSGHSSVLLQEEVRQEADQQTARAATECKG
jgi:hypothetical protein